MTKDVIIVTTTSILCSLILAFQIGFLVGVGLVFLYASLLTLLFLNKKWRGER